MHACRSATTHMDNLPSIVKGSTTCWQHHAQQNTVLLPQSQASIAVILHRWAGQIGDSLAKAHCYPSPEPGLDIRGQAVADIIWSSEWESQAWKCGGITRLHRAMGHCTHSRPRNFYSLQLHQLEICIFCKGKGKKYALKQICFVFLILECLEKQEVKRNKRLKGKSNHTSLPDKDLLWNSALLQSAPSRGDIA